LGKPLSNKYIHSKTMWALSEEARECVNMLEKYGMDKDLAISILESLFHEDFIYDLDSENQAVEIRTIN